MFSVESNTAEAGLQELWAVYQRLDEKERALLLEIARVFGGSGRGGSNTEQKSAQPK